MRVLIAPDKFKGTLTAVEAASAIAAGWLSVRPDDAVEQVPLADGGEGRSTRSSPRAAGVAGGSASEVRSARRSRLRTGSSARAVAAPTRRAAASAAAARRRPTRSASCHELGHGRADPGGSDARRALVCLGGSATNDAGAGMAQALDPFPRRSRTRACAGGAALLDLATIDTSGLDPSLRDTSLVAARDVDNPLVGPTGATAVYGPQKERVPRTSSS